MGKAAAHSRVDACTRRAIANIDPLLVEAAREVDRTLLHWSLSLSLRQRLTAATQAARVLRRFRHVSSEAS